MQVRDKATGELVEKADYEVSSEGLLRRKTNGKPVAQWYDRHIGSGHVVATVAGVRYKVAHVVLWSFVGMPEPHQTDAAHWDDDRRNNRISNLRWAARRDNLADLVFTRPEHAPYVQHMRDKVVWIFDPEIGRGQWIYDP